MRKDRQPILKSAVAGISTIITANSSNGSGQQAEKWLWSEKKASRATSHGLTNAMSLFDSFRFD